MKNLLLASLFTLITTLACSQNRNIIKTAENIYQCGLFTGIFRYEKMSHGDDTDDSNWCMAACIKMALDYDGLVVTQEQIFSLGSGGGRPATAPMDLIVEINKVTPAAWSTRPSHIFTETANVNEDAIFDELSNNRPVLVSFRETNNMIKTNVITAMSYSIKFNDKGEQIGITPLKVTLRDPSPSAASIKTVTWTDLINSTTTLYTINVSYK